MKTIFFPCPLYKYLFKVRCLCFHKHENFTWNLFFIMENLEKSMNDEMEEKEFKHFLEVHLAL